MFDNYDLATLKATWGVYAIVRKQTGRQYIGSTGDSFFNRWKTHYFALRSGKHENAALQWDWLFFGADCFEFRVIEPYTGRPTSIRVPRATEPWARHREAVVLFNAHNVYNVQMPAARTLAGERAQYLSSRIWEEFYGSPPPLCPNHDWWARLGRR